MTAAPRAWVDRVASSMERRFGFSFSANNAQILDGAVSELCSTADEAHALAQAIEVADVTRAPLKTFLAQVLIGETYFLRIPEQFEALRESAVQLLGARGALDVWSCGCATGEEPYSLAMALLDVLGATAKVRVVGSDLHHGFLELAAQARYSQRAVRLVPQSWKTAYLEVEGRSSRPSAQVRAWVQLAPWNLLDGPFQGQTFDIVFCRNMLIYMSAAGLAKAAEALRRAVRPGGLLFLGAADALGALPGFRMLERSGALLFERMADAQDKPSASPPRAPAARPSSRDVEAVKAGPSPLLQAKALLQHGHLLQARAQLEQLCTGSGAPLEAFSLLARLMADGGERAAARAVLERALQRDPTDVACNHLFALLCEETGEWERAEQHLRRTVCANADFAVGHVGLGALYRKMGQPALAQKHLELASTLLKGRAAEEVLPGAHHTSVGWLTHAIETLLKDLTRSAHP